MSELIAEARVLVTPDTTQFRRLLDAEITAATKTPVTVPVTPVLVGGTAGAAAQAEVVAGARAATESAAKLTAATTTASAVRTQFARTETLVADAEKRAALAATEAAAAQIRYNAAVTASRAAQNAYAAALTTTDDALRLQAGLIVAVTAENERLAFSQALVAKSARSEAAALTEAAAAQSAGLGGLAKGGTSAAASLLGVRGATLAATGPFIAGAAGAIAFGKALSIATGFTQQLSVFAAVTGATADQMERVSAAAQQLGKDITLPGVSASDAAEAMTEFAKAGLSVNDAIAATRGGLQLATAAQLSNAEAVTLTANALNAFKLSGDQAVTVADTLANAANAAQGSIADIGLGLRQSASAAAAVGVSFEDTTALLTLLAKNGLTASDAGTSLRTAFIRLVNPSKAAAKILSDLNITLRDAQGNVRPEVFAEFADAQKNLAKATQDANTAIVFGQDAFRAQAVLGAEGIRGLNTTRTALEEQGTAARVAGARMKGLAGSTANLKNQLEALGLSIGQKVTPFVQDLVDQLAGIASGTSDAIDGIEALKNEIDDLPGPDTSNVFGFLKDNLVSGVENLNPIAGQILRLQKAFKDGADDTKDAAVSAGAEIASAIEDSGRAAARGAVGFGDQITGALDAAFALVQRSIRQGIRGARLQGTAQGAGQQAGLEEQFSGILASGGSLRAQIANLKRQAEVQAKIIERAGPDAAGVLLERRRAAREKLASINQQIVGIEAGIAADQKAAQEKAQGIRDAAAKAQADAAAKTKAANDAAFLAAQEDTRGRQERLIGLAGDTAGLADDIRQQQVLRVLITRQIDAIRASALSEDAKKQAIKDLAKARQSTTDEINRLVVTDRQQRAAQRKQLSEEALQATVDLAQSIFDLTGNKDPLLRAIQSEITHQTKIRDAAKAGSVAAKNAQAEINKLLLQRKELNKKAEDAADETKHGLTAFDILQQNAETFNQTGGNLITGNQPFAGPTGFTADVAQFLHRAPTVQTAQADFAAPLVSVNAELIRVIQDNTDAIRGNTDGTKVTPVGDSGTWGNSGWWARSFYKSKQAMQLVESESP